MQRRLVALARAHPLLGGFPRPTDGIAGSRNGREGHWPGRPRSRMTVLAFMIAEASALYDAMYAELAKDHLRWSPQRMDRRGDELRERVGDMRLLEIHRERTQHGQRRGRGVVNRVRSARRARVHAPVRRIIFLVIAVMETEDVEPVDTELEVRIPDRRIRVEDVVRRAPDRAVVLREVAAGEKRVPDTDAAREGPAVHDPELAVRRHVGPNDDRRDLRDVVDDAQDQGVERP